jgi:tRNA(Ile)-lysidine synthase
MDEAPMDLTAPPRRVAVASSGGRDSTALLHCTAHAAAEHGVEVHALHVHHGLQAAADDWWQHVQGQCRRWARSGLPVHFHGQRLNGSPEGGDSIEAWARRERYRALGDLARQAGCDLVLLAHHRRDQAETLLLQALRGGGPAGLAAMPRSASRAGITWARPWLDQPREAIEAYLRRHRLTYVDDPSNGDTRLARNRFRAAVWPALTHAFPDAEASLVHAAQRAQEAAACLAELAALDLARATRDAGAVLDVNVLLGLSPARRAHLLRAWLATVLGAPVPDSLVQRLAAELERTPIGRWPAPGGELRCHDGGLRLQRLPPAPPAASSGIVDLRQPGCVTLPGWGGECIVTEVEHGGVAIDDLQAVELRARCGGERFQATPNAPPRSLKKQFQARRVPAWSRDGPLLFSQGRLLFVPGLGVDARRLAAAGADQRQLVWRPERLDAAAADGPGITSGFAP